MTPHVRHRRQARMSHSGSDTDDKMNDAVPRDVMAYRTRRVVLCCLASRTAWPPHCGTATRPVAPRRSWLRYSCLTVRCGAARRTDSAPTMPAMSCADRASERCDELRCDPLRHSGMRHGAARHRAEKTSAGQRGAKRHSRNTIGAPTL